MLTTLLDKVGLRWTLRIWAIMTCTLTGIAFLGVRPRIPVAKRAPGQQRPRLIVPQMRYFKSPLWLSFVRLLPAPGPGWIALARLTCEFQ